MFILSKSVLDRILSTDCLNASLAKSQDIVKHGKVCLTLTAGKQNPPEHRVGKGTIGTKTLAWEGIHHYKHVNHVH